MRTIRRELRKNQTPTEKFLWQNLRRKSMGCVCRRQHSIGNYVVDFFFPSKLLIVEVDGKIHEKQKQKDFRREQFLKSVGCKVMRFTNEEVLRNLENVLRLILTELKKD